MAPRLLLAGTLAFGGAAAVPNDVQVLPRPAHVELVANCSVDAAKALAGIVRTAADPAGIALVRERFDALGIASHGEPLAISATVAASAAPRAAEGYSLEVAAGSIRLHGADGAGLVYAYATLAQLAPKASGVWRIPCARITDAPALR
ncbi:MAG: hypothetical protein IAI49_03820, partial [Candidatus Eremiobacteraeota bacterium]|nr:hypothetical protein [Candidatus Eremiobacteraeota bacterium]